MALKLHSRFSHPTAEKLLKLLNWVGEPWNNDEELKHHFQKVREECTICQVYRKSPPRPLITFSIIISRVCSHGPQTLS